MILVISVFLENKNNWHTI